MLVNQLVFLPDKHIKEPIKWFFWILMCNSCLCDCIINWCANINILQKMKLIEVAHDPIKKMYASSHARGCCW